jgi:hypothetical protein
MGINAGFDKVPRVCGANINRHSWDQLNSLINYRHNRDNQVGGRCVELRYLVKRAYSVNSVHI